MKTGRQGLGEETETNDYGNKHTWKKYRKWNESTKVYTKGVWNWKQHLMITATQTANEIYKVRYN